MLKAILGNNIQVLEQCSSWEEAIHQAIKPLEESGKVRDFYKEAIIDKVNKLGFYIVLAPCVAFPHGRPEDGVNEQCISILKLNKPVMFGNNAIQLVVAFGAVDNSSHLELLQELMTLLSDSQTLEKILMSESKSDILALL